MNIDISDIIKDLEDFALAKEGRGVLPLKNKQEKALEQNSQTELFYMFKKTLEPLVNESFLSLDNERFDEISNANEHDALVPSMSFNFVEDVKTYSKYYLQQLEFAYYLKTGKNLFVVSQDSENFLAPISMIFSIHNFLPFFSIKSIEYLQKDLNYIYEKLFNLGYCNDSQENSPNLSISLRHIDFSFHLNCTNNFLDLDIPNELKHEFYFFILSRFIKNILNELDFNFVEIGKNKEQDYIDIYPAFVRNKKVFFKTLTNQIIKDTL